MLGLDLSEPFIRSAKHMQNKTLQFAKHDMRQAFPSQNFHAIFNIFTSFGHFDTVQEDLCVLTNMYNALRPNGLVLLDYLNAPYVRMSLVPRDNKSIQGIHFKLRRHIEEPYVFKRIEVQDEQRRFEYVERVRLLDLAQFQAYFKATKLQLLETFGDYDLRPYDPAHSHRLICLVQRINS